MRLIVTGPVRNEGSIIVLEGVDPEEGGTYHFAADHRPARDIIDALSNEEDVEVDVEPWQIIGGPRS